MPQQFDRCVKQVKSKGGAVNAYAVCRASLGTDKEIMHKKKKKKRY